jgi:hypothetical protein
MDNPTVWAAAMEAIGALARCYRPEMERAAAEVGLGEYAGLLFTALTFEPEPISAARLRIRSPYTAERFYNRYLTGAASLGFLAQAAQQGDAYQLTEKGKAAMKQVMVAVYARMAEQQALPASESQRLAGLLHRLVVASLAAPEPPGKWSISHSRRIDQGEEAPAMVRIDQYISDLAGYRDDSHLAAWQQHNIAGHIWEAFTFVWRGDTTNLDALSEELARRGHTREEYQQAIGELVGRGWLTEESGDYQVTPSGDAIRQEAEDATNRYFFAPWSVLSQEELEELKTLLHSLRDGLGSS